jgi:hypothetical protein
MTRPSVLICTVGTSLFRPNLEGLKKDLTDGTIRDDLKPLAQAYQQRDCPAVARELAQLSPSERTPARPGPQAIPHRRTAEPGT